MKKQKKRSNNWFARFCRRAFYEFVKYTGAVVILPFMRVKRHYMGKKMPKGNLKAPLMMVSNHVCLLDAISLLAAFPSKKFSFLTASDALLHRGGWFLRALLAIPIDRENPKLSSIKECLYRFKLGDVLCIFAEGRLPLPHESLEIRSFKPGGAFIAAIADVDIVPVFIAPRISYWHRQHIVVGTRIKIGDYIFSKPAKIDDIKTLSDTLENQVKALREYYYSLPKIRAKNKEYLDNTRAKRLRPRKKARDKCQKSD